MRGAVEDIQVLFNNPAPTTFYLEKDSIGAFVQWVQNDTTRALLLGSPWNIIVFRHQIVQYADHKTRRRKLREFHIEINNNNPSVQDSLFINEVERTYFSNGSTNHHQLAEFYILVRRTVGDGWVNIISQDRSFERVPMVNSYFVGTSPRTGSQDLPAQFDFIQDFNIHPNLSRMVSARLNDPNRGNTVFDSITVLRDYIRVMSGLTLDGKPLMHQAFDDANPLVRINPMTDPDPRHTQRNEQQGFHDFYNGVMTGMRNPLAHEGPTSSFASSRYPDKATMLKYLSFLSLLCERADGPLP